MQTLPIRLTPGQNLHTALGAAVLSQNCRAAFVLSGIGSLSTAGPQFVGVGQPVRLTDGVWRLAFSRSIIYIHHSKFKNTEFYAT